MKHVRLKTLRILALVLIAGLMCAACVTSSSTPVKDKMSENIIYNMPDSASITGVNYFYADYKGTDRLHFEVTVKNKSQVPHRYRLNILLPQGPAVGGMYPRKEKAIAPGKSLTRKFPVYIDAKKLPADFMPTGFTLVLKEL